MIVAVHGNKPIPIGTLRSIIEGASLSADDFRWTLPHPSSMLISKNPFRPPRDVGEAFTSFSQLERSNVRKVNLQLVTKEEK